MAPVISLASILVQLLALNAPFLAYPTSVIMSYFGFLVVKSAVRQCDIGWNRVYRSDNPRPGTIKKRPYKSNLRKKIDNVKLFLQLFKDFWNSSNGIYDNLSVSSVVSSCFSGIFGSASSKAWCIAVSL